MRDALLKIYLDEPEAESAEATLTGERWVTGRHTLVDRQLADAAHSLGWTVLGA